MPASTDRAADLDDISFLGRLSEALSQTIEDQTRELFETLRYEIKGSGVNVMLVCPGFTATDLRKNALVGDGSVAAQPPLAMGKVASPQDVAEAIYHGALKRRRLLVLSNVDWRARVLARFFPRLFERVLLPRLSGMKPRPGG